MVPPKTDFPPAWTKLDYRKCSHCPLSSTEFPTCPVALNLSQLVDALKDKMSYDHATVQVSTVERNYVKTLSLQEGIFSLFGLIMPFTACPYTQFLRPMAKYHLPFATPQETLVRSVSFYLLRQYFVAKNGGQPDIKLTELGKRYEKLQIVNQGLINRIRGIVKKDLELNAFIILTSITDILTREITKELTNIEPTFSGPSD